MMIILLKEKELIIQKNLLQEIFVMILLFLKIFFLKNSRDNILFIENILFDYYYIVLKIYIK